MTAIERHQGAAIPDKLAYADALARADLLPKGYRNQPGNVLLAVEFGEMLDVHPLSAIQQVHVVEGKLTASAELMRALALRAGHKVRVLRHDAEAATVAVIRADDPDHVTEVTFTMADAKRANLTGKNVWRSYPAAMLLARATSAVIRAACPEVLMGVSYTPEELGAPVSATGEIIDVDPIDPVTVPVAEAKRRLLEACDDDRERARAVWADAFPEPVTHVDADDLADLLATIEAPAPPALGESSLPMGEPDDPARDDGGVAEPPRGGHEAGEEVAATEGMGVPAATSDPVPDDEIIDGELVDDDPPPDQSGEMTQAQNRKLHVLMAKAGASGPDRHHLASDMLGRRIESMKDVTKAEAARMIDRLEADEDPFDGFPKDAA